jgi:transcriptional regulator with XRE-family HTH domain
MTKLRFYRLDRRLSQRQLASLAQLPACELSRIETRRLNPTPAELSKLSAALGVPAERLLDPVVLDPTDFPNAVEVSA